MALFAVQSALLYFAELSAIQSVWADSGRQPHEWARCFSADALCRGSHHPDVAAGMVAIPHQRGLLAQNVVSFSNSLTRFSMSVRLILSVRFNPKPSQQKDATTLP